MSGHSRLLRWAALLCGLLTLVLVPFALWGPRIEAGSLAWLRGEGAFGRGALVIGLLASDVVLPIPSSIVATLSGTYLGLWGGAMASMIGMTIGASVGYALGRWMRGPVVTRLLGPAVLTDAERWSSRFGPWAIALARPVPVLAEASVVLAGIHRMAIGPFLASMLLSNLGLSLVYSAAGALSSTGDTFFPALVAAVALPGLARWAARRGAPVRTAASGDSAP